MNSQKQFMRVIGSKILIIFVLLIVLSCKRTESSNIYLEINLNDAVSTNSFGNPFGRRVSPLEVFRVIERAAQDNNIKGIILNIGYLNRSREYLWELRNALEQFKVSGENKENEKKIIAYISNADIDVYMLASVADKIVMNRLGILTMLGYSAGRGYVSQTLGRFGIGVMELRYFEYKSAAESYTRTDMSEADRRQYNDYLDDIFNITRLTLTEARGWTIEEFNNIINRNFMHSADSALTHNFVDYVGGMDSVRQAIKNLENEEIDFYIYGSTENSLTESNKKYAAPRNNSATEIAVVYANGETDMTRGMEIAKLSKQITNLANNNRVKAIVVRINSPGGSAQAAEVLAEAIRYAKQKKPVVVSMGQVAASGGYWAAIPASHITANPYTITGSIGVIGSWFYNNGFYNMLGVSVDVLKRGEHSDLMTGFLIPHRRLTAIEEDQYKNYILNLYNIFTEKVASGRNMSRAEVEAVAQGRIFSGIRALDEGLIDSVGSLYDSLKIARNLANISDTAAVSYREYPEPKFLDLLLGNFSASSNVNLSVPNILDSILPDISYRLENNGQVMPIMPFEFSIW